MQRITVERTLYIIILLAALGVRFLNLGVKPLSDYEAGWALQAFHLSEGEAFTPGSQTGYVTITGALFALFGSSTALARFWPALMGGLLVLFPWLVRGWLGRRSALIFALGLALDPGLVATSRLAGSSMPAVGLLSLALGLVLNQQPLLGGLCAGLALLHGVPTAQGLVAIALSLGAVHFLQKIQAASPTGFETDQSSLSLQVLFSRKFWIAAAAVFLLLGSGFGGYPQGLGAWAASLPAYLSGWVVPAGISALSLAALLAIYQPLTIVLGIVGLVRAGIGRNALDRLLALWFLIAFTLTMLYPGRQAMDLAWVIVPLWGTAAAVLAGSLTFEPEQKFAILGQACLLLILMMLLWLNLAGIAQQSSAPQIDPLRQAVILGVIGLAGLTTTLMGLGWSWQAAWKGLTIGLSSAFLIYSLANIWDVSQLRKDLHPELWAPAPVSQNADLLLETVRDLSNWSTNRADGIDVLLALDAPSVEWLLRSYPRLKKVASLQEIPSGETPSIVITRQLEVQPSLAAGYRGQAIYWWQTPTWTGALPADMMRWIVFRQASDLTAEQLILWARADLFPGGYNAQIGGTGQTGELQDPDAANPN